MKFTSRKNTNFAIRKTSVAALALLCLMGMGKPGLHAASLTWDTNSTNGTVVDGPGSWTTATTGVGSKNWLNTATNQTWINGSDAVFGVNPSTTTTGATTLILTSNVTVNDIYVQNDNKMGGVTINTAAGNTFVLTIQGSMAGGLGNGMTFGSNLDVAFTNGIVATGTTTLSGSTVTGGMGFTVSGSAAVTGNITTAGGDSVTLSGTTTIASGNITALGGTVTLSGSVTNTGGSNITISGGTVDMSSGKYATFSVGNVTLSAGTLKIIGTGASAFPTLTGTFGMTGGTLDVNGVYSGTLGTGINQLNISGNDSFSGGSASGTFNFTTGGVAGGTLIYGTTPGFNPGQLTFSVAGGNNTTLLNNLDLNTATTRALISGANGTSLTILSGSLIDSGGGATNGVNGSGNVGFESGNGATGGGIWIDLTGTETYTGTTFIGGTNAGGNNNLMRLVLGSGSANASIATSNIVFSGTKAGQFGVNITGTTTIAANIVTATGTDNTSGQTTFSGSNQTVIIGGTGTATNGVATGTGTVIFTGNNTYVGGTLLQSGTLQIGNGGTAGTLPTGNNVTGLAGTALVYDLSNNATLSGSITGGMGFTQAGTGEVTLNNGPSQNYTGQTTISSGTLQLGDGTSDGNIASGTIANSGTLIFNNISTEAYSGTISGAGGLYKTGGGNQTLSSNLGYTGVTNVAAGTLTLTGNNTNSTTAITLNGGTLAVGGVNAIAGAKSITVNTGATLNLAFGSGTHAITVAGSAGNALVLTGGGTINFNMGNGIADELVFTSGSASISGITNITATALASISLSSPTALIFVPGGGIIAADFTATGLTGATFTTDGNTLWLTTGVTITTAYWKGSSNGNWSNSSNFTSDAGGTIPTVGGVTSSLSVVFSASGATNQASTVLDANVSAKNLIINDTANVVIGGSNNNTLTIGDNAAITTGATSGTTTIGANVALTGAAPVISVTGTNPLTISGSLATSTGVTVSGGGLLALTGNNNYTGGTVLSGGTIQVNSATSLGSSASSLTFSGGAPSTLQLLPSIGTLSSSRNIIFSNLGVGAIATIDSNGNNLVLGGNLTGSGTFNSVSTAAGGITTLTGADTGYTGNITVGSGTLQLGNGSTGGAPSSSSSITVAAGAVLSVDLSGSVNFANSVAGSGTLIANGPVGSRLALNGNENINTYIVNSGTMSWESGVTLFGNAVNPVGSVTINAGATLINNKGDAIGGSSSASPAVTLTINSGTFIENASITNFGALNLNGGSVITQVGNSGQFPSLSFRGNITVAGSAESFINTTIPGSSNGNIRLSGSNSATSDITTFNVGVTGAGIDLSVNANLEDGWAYGTQNLVNTTFIKTGNGTMQLSGTGQWGGGTQINGGVLLLNNASALPTAAIVAAGGGTTQTGTLGAISFGGGTLEYSSNNQVDYSNNFSTAASQVVSINTNGQGITYATGLTSSGGTLDVYDTAATTGTLSLTGVSTYSGLTTIHSGNLAVNNSIAGAVNITPNNSAKATLSGNGAIGGLVTTANASGANVAHIAPGINTSGNLGGVGTLTLNGGLTLGDGTQLDFDLGGSSDLIIVNGTVTLGNTITLNLGGGSIALGTAYTLITSSSALVNAGDVSSWIVSPANEPVGTTSYTFSASSGTSVTITFNSSAFNPTTYTVSATPANSRVIVGQTTSVSNVITNTGTTGSPASDSLSYTNLGNATAANGSISSSPSAGTIAPTTSATNTSTYTAGPTTGLDTITPSGVTGTNANLGGAATLQSTTSGTVAVLANRSVTATTVAYGDVLSGVAQTGSTTLSTASGDDNHATRITVLSGSAGNGTVTVNSGTGNVLFNGNGVGSGRTVGATFGTSGAASGSVNLGVTGEGLTGESDTAPTVNYTANVFQAFSGSTSVTSGTTLTLTNLASTDVGGQRAGVTVSNFTTNNANFVVTGGGSVGTANGSDVAANVGTVGVSAGALSGTYSYTGNITANAQYTDTALQGTGVANQTWSGVTLSGTVNATAGFGTTKSAFVANGGSLTGYGLTSSSGSNTTATLLAGSANGDTTVTMEFTQNGGHGSNSFQSSDTLTLGGMNSTGTGTLGQTLTAPFVLQLSYGTNPNVTGGYFIGWYQGGNWVNAIAGDDVNQVADTGGFTVSYATFVANNPSLTLAQQVGAYGYYFDASLGLFEAWAVIDHNSDFEVIPEPSTYAMIFSGFGMLLGVQKMRRRHQKMRA